MPDWRQRALDAEDELGRLRQIEMREIGARIMARRFWEALKARTGWEAEALFGTDVLRIVDPTFDAVETVYERHRVTIVPCRSILDDASNFGFDILPGQPEMYLGRWPDGSTRNLTRDQLLMMGGQDLAGAN